MCVCVCVWQSLDLSLFDLISNENKLSRYETEEVIPKLKVTRQLIEEIHSAPEPPPRPKACKIKPMKYVAHTHTHVCGFTHKKYGSSAQTFMTQRPVLSHNRL